MGETPTPPFRSFSEEEKKQFFLCLPLGLGLAPVVSIVGSFQPLLQLLLIIIGSASSSRCIYNRQRTLITDQPNLYNLSSRFCSGPDVASKLVSVARYIHNGRLEAENSTDRWLENEQLSLDAVAK